MNSYQEQYKISVLGDGGTGKTSLIKRYVKNEFSINTLNTLGVDMSYKTMTIKEGGKEIKIKLTLFDTAGQEKYHSLAPTYFRGAQGVLFLFAVNDQNTFDHIDNWYKLLKNNANEKDIPIYLIGSKNDLEHIVKDEDVKKYAEDNKFTVKYCSSKNNEGINEIFEEITEKIFKNKKLRPSKDKKKIHLGKYNSDKNKETEGCFCNRQLINDV